jgi:hypothetical protein
LLVALTIVWAAWAGWSLLGRATPYTLRVLDDVGTPVALASVDVEGSQVGTSSEDGLVDLTWNRSSTVIEVSAPGHVPLMLTVAERPDGVMDVVLKARVLRGLVVDAEGVPIEGARVSAGSASGSSDSEGHFDIRGAQPGPISVVRPAWLSNSFTWDGGSGETLVELTPFIARAVHIDGESVGRDLETYIEMAQTTELNALMIDLKGEAGFVWFNSRNAFAEQAEAVRPEYDLGAVTTKAHADDLYVIGRIVAFNDPMAARAIPEMAVWDTSTDQPLNRRGQWFLDPTDRDARAYALGLAQEACSMGVDEIQFDYVRFPDVGQDVARFDGGSDQETFNEIMSPTISSFLSEAVAILHPLGCAVGADIFGFLTTAQGDGGIGQRWEDLTQIVDVASPMVYPSHYDPGWYGFEDPNANPGPMVDNALGDGIGRLQRNVIVRPWLQDFGYTPEQVRAQIDSAEGYGLGWMLWNAKSEVTTEALRPSPQ